MTSDAEQRIRDYLDAREPWAKADGWSFVPDGISRVGDPYDVQLNESDLRDVLAQLDQARDDADFTQALAALDQLTRERDEARDVARTLTRHNGIPVTAALCRLKLDIDPPPNWLTTTPDDATQHPAPSCAPTPNALICACGQDIGHAKEASDG